MTIIYTLFVAHFVADFLCQTDWMALNKSKSWVALGLHVSVYSMALMVTIPLGMVVAGHGKDPASAFFDWLAVNAAAHFVQDAITSRITSRLWFLPILDEMPAIRSFTGAGPFYMVRLTPTRHWFFVMIGFDQLLHYVTLFITASWWLK